jgi:hypothetical protein
LQLFFPDMAFFILLADMLIELQSGPLLCNKAGKVLKRTIVCPFGISGKAAGWQLPAFKMITQALTAVAFSWTRFISAVA